MKCSTTREIIDQADDPASLPYQTAAHVDGCSSCRQFASEREQLRKLLLEPRRVSAPANFEAMVARRLAQRGASRPFWAPTGFYLRAAGAAVALACLVLVIQVVRLKPVFTTAPSSTDIARVNPAITAGDTGTKKNTPADRSGTNSTPTPGGPVKAIVPVHHRNSHVGPMKVDSESALTAVANLAAQPQALILVRNSGSEQEIAVPMISVGATPWVPVSVRPQDERGLRVAF